MLNFGPEHEALTRLALVPQRRHRTRNYAHRAGQHVEAAAILRRDDAHKMLFGTRRPHKAVVVYVINQRPVGIVKQPARRGQRILARAAGGIELQRLLRPGVDGAAVNDVVPFDSSPL